jgi:hypothetical protein
MHMPQCAAAAWWRKRMPTMHDMRAVGSTWQCMQAKRLLRGVDLQHAMQRPSMMQYLSALATFLATALLHQLAKILVYKKVRKVRPMTLDAYWMLRSGCRKALDA